MSFVFGNLVLTSEYLTWFLAVIFFRRGHGVGALFCFSLRLGGETWAIPVGNPLPTLLI
jgi:hypothetical protein